MKTVILVGVPGSGKSSILKEVLKQIPSVAVVNYGDEMLKVAALHDLSRDMLRKMPYIEQKK